MESAKQFDRSISVRRKSVVVLLAADAGLGWQPLSDMVTAVY